MKRNQKRIVRWINFQNNWTATISDIVAYIEDAGFKEMDNVVIPDAMPTHLLLYEDRTYLPSFMPINLTADTELKNEAELLEYIEFLKIAIVYEN